MRLYILGDVRRRPLRVPSCQWLGLQPRPAGSLASQAHTRRGGPGLLVRVWLTVACLNRAQEGARRPIDARWPSSATSIRSSVPAVWRDAAHEVAPAEPYNLRCSTGGQDL